MAGMGNDLGILLLACLFVMMEASRAGRNLGETQMIPKVESPQLQDHRGGSEHLDQRGSESHTRTKRCTCYSYRDKECVYYCHLDIIWINTPERTVPYGMSDYRGSQRIKRSSGKPAARGVQDMESLRCVCADQKSQQCTHFCRRSQASTIGRTPRGRGPG